MKPSAFPVTLALGLCLLAGALCGIAAERPNILFVFTDDHAAHAISAYGSKINQTPNMDRLAREGMLFRRCYVANAICGPSRATILTGKYSHLNGFMINGGTPFDGSQQTFPKLLQKAGYQTAIVGKWHLLSTPTGFDYFDVLIGQGPYYNPPMRTLGPDGEVVTRRHTGYTTDIITDKALDWLAKSRDNSKPFLLMYQHKAPHREWAPNLKDINLYDDMDIPEPETLWDDYANRASPARNQKMSVAHDLSDKDLKLDDGPDNLTPEQRAEWRAKYGPKNEAFRKANLTGRDRVKWQYQRYIKDYLRCVHSVDENLGRVLKYLDDTGLAQNTVVIYSSDQGWYLGDHGWYDKRWMYEPSLIMPLIVRWPGTVRAGSENSDIVSNLDFAETFLEMAGASIPQDMQGRSLVPLLKGQTPADWRKTFYYHYFEYPGAHSVARHYGVTNGRHKLIHYYELGEWELFDLTYDPNEMKSFYGQPDYASVQQGLERELDQLRRQFLVPAHDPPESYFPRDRR